MVRSRAVPACTQTTLAAPSGSPPMAAGRRLQMARPCSVCRHPERAAIDAALVAGEPYRRVASRFETSEASIRRHKGHLSQHLARAHEAKEVAQADSLLDQLKALPRKLLKRHRSVLNSPSNRSSSFWISTTLHVTASHLTKRISRESQAKYRNVSCLTNSKHKVLGM